MKILNNLDRVEQIMGHRFEKHHLKARYGRRWKKQKEGQGDGGDST